METLLATREVSLTSVEVHTEIQARAQVVNRDMERELGLNSTSLEEITVHGIHRLFVLDETTQQSGNFKFNGASLAVHRLRQTNPEVHTVVTGTAGNFGAALAQAASGAGLRAELHAPVSVSLTKQENMERAGGIVYAQSTDVMEAIARAEQVASSNPHVAFVHPFNNLDAIAGQSLIGRRLVEGLLANGVTGPVDVIIQRGGGSLLAGVASAVRASGLTNVRVHEVRPALVNGRLDSRYDGLAVHEPGSYAAALLSDPEFVADTIEITEADTGRAAHRMAWALRKRYEPSGLAGVAGFEQHAGDNKTKTTYVAVLSGANVLPEVFADFMDAPRRHQEHILRGLANSSLDPAELLPTQRRGRSLVATSPTATYKR